MTLGTNTGPLGIIYDESESDYRSSGCVGNSILSDFLEDEGYFHRKYIIGHIVEAPTPDMKIGLALHCYMEDFKKYLAKYVIAPSDFDARTKDGKAWKLAQTREIITRDNHVKVSRMAASIRRHPETFALYAGSRREVTVRLDVPQWGLPVQARPDCWSRCIVDWKKVDSVESFPKKVTDFGYHRQAALYSYLIGMATMEDAPPFVFVAVEDKEPFRVKQYALSDAWMERGWNEVDSGMKRLAHAIKNNVWKYHNIGIHTIEPKPWDLAKDIA